MFILPSLPYDLSALEPHIDAQTMEIHHDKHHGTYVKNLNEVLMDKEDIELEDILRNLSALPEDIRTKVRNNGGGHYNHSLFWQLLSPTPTQPTSKLLAAITASFGNLEAFKEKFTAAALGRFGSGWVWLVKNEGLEIIDTPNQDSPVMDGKQVLLGLDVWEHAYYLKYQNRRKDYVDAFWNVVNWSFVSARYESDRS